MAGKTEFVNLQVSENKVCVFSKSYCPYCKKAKEALADAGLKEYVLLELDQRDDGDAIQDALLKITGGRSVWTTLGLPLKILLFLFSNLDYDVRNTFFLQLFCSELKHVRF